MDTLKIIKEKVETLSTTVTRDGLMAVVKHLEVAEEHYSRGTKTDDQDTYTDVIYRTNHAFEGILREAYTLLAEKDPRNKQTHQIEKYFIDNEVFKQRVTELFTQYRTKWRNPSTHEHQLFFTQQEAFLSILSVTSFVSILLDQMIEKSAFDIEKSVETFPDKDTFEKLQKMPFSEQIVYLLPTFYRQMILRSPEEQILDERQLIGRLHAFLYTIIPGIKIDVDPIFADKGVWYRPDFVLSRNDEKIILEVKRGMTSVKSAKKKLEYQMLSFLKAAHISSGIVFIYPTGSLSKRQKNDIVETIVPDSEHEITFVTPGYLKENE